MADAEVTVNVKSTADTSGIKQVDESLKGLKQTAEETSVSTEALGASIGGALAGGAAAAATAAVAMIVTAWRQLEEENEKLVESMQKATDEQYRMGNSIADMMDKFNQLKALRELPLTEQIIFMQKEVAKLKQEFDIAFRSTQEMTEETKKLGEAYIEAANKLRSLQELQRGSVQAMHDQEALNQALAYGTEKEIEGARYLQIYNQILEQHRRLGQDISHETIAAATEAQIAAGERVTAEDKVQVALRESATMLQGIRQQQQLIASAPFMGIDEKQAALIVLYHSEMQGIAASVRTLQDLRPSITDPVKLAQVDAAIQHLGFSMQQLGQKTAAALNPMQAELQRWANSFGALGTQVAKTLEQSINASLASLNQYLLTGQFNAKQLVQQIANLGLQLLENLAIQKLMAIFSRQQAAESQAEGVATAAANAPAAAAKSIAQYGPIVGAAAAIAAVAAIIASIVMHEGGPVGRRRVRRMHSGGLAEDEVPIIAQEGEFIVNREVAAANQDFLVGLNAGRFHRGGQLRRYHPGGVIDYFGNYLADPMPSPIPAMAGFGSGFVDIGPAGRAASGAGGGSMSVGGTDIREFIRGAGAFGYYALPDYPGVYDDAAGNYYFDPSAYGGLSVPSGLRGGGGGGGGGGRGRFDWGGWTIGGVTQTGVFTPGWRSPVPVGPQTIGGGYNPYSIYYGGGTMGLHVSTAMGASTGGFMPMPGGMGERVRVLGESGMPGTADDTWAMKALRHGWNLDVYAPTPYTPLAISASSARWFASHRPSAASLTAMALGTTARGHLHGGGRVSRYHNGGGISGGGGAFGDNVHIYAFTDMKALIRHMGSREGQKIIFDTVRGNRINLGMR